MLRGNTVVFFVRQVLVCETPRVKSFDGEKYWCDDAHSNESSTWPK